MDKFDNQADVQKSLVVAEKKRKRGNALRQNTLPLHIMLLPALLLVLVYNYAPMLGIAIAFQDFSPEYAEGSILRLFFGSPLADYKGLGHFVFMFNKPDAMRALWNTVIIALWKIVTMFFSPIILALMLNEVRKEWFKKTVQTVVYLPHFLSWVIMAGIIFQILSRQGIVNNLCVAFVDFCNSVFNAGFEPWERIAFLQDKNLFRGIIIITNMWKEIGWSTIVYLAAIAGVDPTLYEAAVMDGAGKAKQCWHVTLPGMKPIIVLTLVLSLQSVLNAGFDQIYNLYNSQVYETGDVLDTYVYRISFNSGQWSLGTAVGLFKSAVSLVLIAISYWLAGKFAGYQIF